MKVRAQPRKTKKTRSHDGQTGFLACEGENAGGILRSRRSTQRYQDRKWAASFVYAAVQPRFSAR